MKPGGQALGSDSELTFPPWRVVNTKSSSYVEPSPAAILEKHPSVTTCTHRGVPALARLGLPLSPRVGPRRPLGAQPPRSCRGGSRAVPAAPSRRSAAMHMASDSGGGATLPRGGAATFPVAGGPRPAHLPRAGGAGGKPPVPLPDGASARAGSSGRSGRLPAPMAGERTRRFTRSLLRPGQAAELRHSAATAAASGRLQQRVSAAGQRRADRGGRAGKRAPAQVRSALGSRGEARCCG